MARRSRSGDVEKAIHERARPQVDIKPCDRSQGVNLPWPSTLPKERKHGYGDGPKNRLNVFVLPPPCGYHPIMAEVEDAIYKLTAKHCVTIVVADSFRGVGEIMSRRLGVNLTVVYTAHPGSVKGPGNQQARALDQWSVARREVLRASDAAILVDTGFGFERLSAAFRAKDKKVKTFNMPKPGTKKTKKSK